MFSFQNLPAMYNTLTQKAFSQLDAIELGAILTNRRRPITVPDGLRVGRTRDKGGALYCTHAIKSGDVAFAFQGRLKPIEQATPLGLQIEENLFLEADPDDPNRFDEFTNHSCNPNGYVCFTSGHPVLVALRDIESGEELTFNYNTTEWDMLEQEAVMKAPSVFRCACLTAHCLGTVMGFRYLSLEQKLLLRSYLSPYLLAKLEAELGRLNVLLLNER